MKTYFALVHRDDDSAYGISFPDLPGCFPAADDLDNLVANARDALGLWFDGAKEVEPRGIDEIHKATADELAGGHS